MTDMNTRFRRAGERVEMLRAEADRARLARTAAGAGRHGRGSFRIIAGDLLIRAGRALGGDRRRGTVRTSGAAIGGARVDRRISTGLSSDDGTSLAGLAGDWS